MFILNVGSIYAHYAVYLPQLLTYIPHLYVEPTLTYGFSPELFFMTWALGPRAETRVPDFSWANLSLRHYIPIVSPLGGDLIIETTLYHVSLCISYPFVIHESVFDRPLA